MKPTDQSSPVVFHAGKNLLVVVGGFSFLFLALGIGIGTSRGFWTFFVVVVGLTAVMLLLLLILKMEIRSDGFSYRSAMTRYSLSFSEIQQAHFVTLLMNGAPTGAAFFVQDREGKSTKVNLRMFPIRAAAMLFDGLERHGIPVQVPDSWHARRMASQISDELAKLRASQ